MKVYVATFYKNNYGSALQAFALQSILKDLNTMPMVIEEPKQDCSQIKQLLRDIYYLLKPEKYYGFIKKTKRLLEQRFQLGKIGKINKFLQMNIITITYDDYLKEIADGKAIALAGSDQIWSIINSPISSFYTFDYIKNKNVKKISYAASIGVSNLSENQIKYYSETLKDFKVISLREKCACEILNGYFQNTEVRCDVDPTLLLDKSIWADLCSEPQVSEPYIFVYMLRPDDSLIDMARVLAKRNHCKIIYIGQFNRKYQNVKTVKNAGVEDFLSYIYNAEYIITNSFHGTVFSILFNKKFVSVRIRSTSSRVENLLKSLDIQYKLISDIRELDNALIDYHIHSVESKLYELRKKSINYLKREVEEEW